eukprot:gene9368-6587_t
MGELQHPCHRSKTHKCCGVFVLINFFFIQRKELWRRRGRNNFLVSYDGYTEQREANHHHNNNNNNMNEKEETKGKGKLRSLRESGQPRDGYIPCIPFHFCSFR